ncbi:MAG: AbrB/MazE/SpoVT family DNA-binding domain-containing protein [Dehalococcoidales bacterium]|nr:AbrB/MazE/SpoVT family DNA-binding domain-containing protein [Dehalococcoidales bacterium]
MKTHIQKWGNSLALRIPKSFAIDAGLQKNTSVELSLSDGRLIIAPVKKPEIKLEQLLANITEDNLYCETYTRITEGKETW